MAGQRLKEISDLERFYHEAARIRRDLDVLLRDLAAAIGPAKSRVTDGPVYISPVTGKRHKIRRAK
jgi:hypothetical protein